MPATPYKVATEQLLCNEINRLKKVYEPSIPTVSSIAAAAPVKSSYTAAEKAYVSYNNNYFKTAEAAGYAAKTWYFSQPKNFVDLNWWQENDGEGDDTPPPWLSEYGSRMGKWNAIKGEGYRPNIDVPSKFRYVDKYFRLAKQAQDDEKKAYDVYLQTKNHTGYSYWANPSSTQSKEMLDRRLWSLSAAEHNYVVYKNEYIAAIEKL
jgi:hypothetical protein